MLFSIILLLLFENTFGNEEDFLVKIKQGILKGKEKKNEVNQESYYAFYDVPYAKPPVGDGRFKDPEEPDSWEGIRNADQEKNAGCVRYNLIFKSPEGEEDCLYLHVFVPKKPEKEENSLKPVMAWIHGGAFHLGSGSPSVYGPDFLMLEDVILVLINYRLCVFGFLSTEDEKVSGNAGLKDQVMALKWIRTNIRAFGGDADKVTIFGESAGGASVHFLMLSPLAKGLLNGAIAQSGTALNPWAMSESPLKSALKLGLIFDCNVSDTQVLVECLRKVDAEDLVTYQYNVITANENVPSSLPFLPIVEATHTKNSFLTENPLTMLKKGKFNDVPFMTGTMEMETLPFAFLYTSSFVKGEMKNLSMKMINERPEAMIPFNWKIKDRKKLKRIGRKIKKFYFRNQRFGNHTLENFVNQTTDTSFLLGTHDAVTYHFKLAKSPVFQYHFVLETPYAKMKAFLDTKIKGPMHADDIGYLFYGGQDVRPDAPGYEGMRNVIKLWANFAKFGNPTPNNELGIVWKAVSQRERNYLEIGESLLPKEYVEKERMQFWENLRLEENITF